jgi:uncharacterized protein with FMN-binding domain
MAKMDKKWVVLCSTAVAAVYASGYFTTETQAANLVPQQKTHFNVQTKTSSPYSRHGRHHNWDNSPSKSAQSNDNQTNSSANTNSQSNDNQTKSPANNSSPSSSTPSNTVAKSKYKDGTYQGAAENRRGFIEVAVTIKNDKISDVEISRWGMHYDESDVDGLPQEVVQNQSVHVQNVSGATYSTEAFEGAVQDALTKAENA